MNKYVVMSWQAKSHKLNEKGFRILSRIIYFMMRVICGCSIPPSVVIGEGTRFAHNGLGVIVHDKCVIGRETVIQGYVVLGGQMDKMDQKSVTIVISERAHVFWGKSPLEMML